MYNKRTWLNNENSPSTGSVVACDDRESWKGSLFGQVFLTIADCRGKVTLHKSEEDSLDDFIQKMELLENEIHKFIDHLKYTK